MNGRCRLAYVFERFPTFTQTFCAREIGELRAQGVALQTYSIRSPSDEPSQSFPPELAANTVYLPGDEPLVTEAKRLQSARALPRPMRRTLESWSSKRDKHRVYAAAWLGPRLRKAGVRHVHVHFAGIAARTAYWLKEFYGIRYSFTGHANDIFCEEPDLPVTLNDLVREARFVVTVSDFSRKALADRFHAGDKIHRVYNGIDTTLWNPGHPQHAPASIVSVGRYIEKKGFADLISACAGLKRRGTPFQCTIIGEGPLEGALRKQCSDLGVEEEVVIAGPRSQTEIRKALESCQVFALPCVEESDASKDNLPTVIMEAMACGLPVVSTRLAGVPEMVLHEKTGLLVDQRRPDDLTLCLDRLLKDPQLRARFGDAGRQHAVSAFDLRVTTRQLKHLFAGPGAVAPARAALAMDKALFWSWITRRSTV